MNRIIVGDALGELSKLPAESVHCCVTSPPYYGLRDYGVAGQLGLEATPDEYVAAMVGVFREVRRVLRRDGTLWLNIGDSYASGGRKTRDPGQSKIHPAFKGDAYSEGLRPADPDGVKPKDLLGIPWMLAFALRADGWWLRQDIIWAKPNPMPESVTDRCTKAHEYLFLLSKSERYYFDTAAIAEAVSENTNPRISKSEIERITAEREAGANSSVGMGPARKTHAQDGMVKANDSYQNAVCLPVSSRNKRSVWTVATAPFAEAHFATFPPALVEPCILAGTSAHGVCPACGAPWVREVERKAYGDKSGPGARSLEKGFTRNAMGGQKEWDAYEPPRTIGWSPSCRCDQRPARPATVLDPFLGAGTTALVADRLGRSAIGIELNPAYAKMARRRLASDAGLFFQAAAD